ncbi:MAG: TetR/AcrR family transcriptional regulator [Gammaproteobacteria bacterium]
MPQPKRTRASRPRKTAAPATGAERGRAFVERARSMAKADAARGSGLLGERAMRTREQLVATAIRLFLERGYGGTTIDEIADAAGLSRASFYTYFPSKREILLLAGARADRARNEAVSALARVPVRRTRAHLQDWVREFLGFLDRYGAFQLVWSQAAWFDEELRVMGVDGSRRSARIVGTHMQRLGARAARNAELQGLAAMSMLERFWYVWKKTRAPYAEEEVVNDLAAMLESLLR